MKMPARPPRFEALLNRSGTHARLPEILGVLESAKEGGQYLHWDKLRFKKPPAGLTHEEWWLGLKMGRRFEFKPIPMQDISGQPFRYSLPDPIPGQLHQIDLGAGGRIEMPEQVTNPDTRDRYYVASLVQEAITSSQLEGAATTREVAKEMLRNERRPRNRHEQMILNNFLTMKRIGKIKDTPLSPELVCEIHRLVTDQTLDQSDDAGYFRTAGRYIRVEDQYNEVYHTPPPAEELPERVRAMCDFANGVTPHHFVHPVVRAIILHFWLAYDHPFVDGNGRTARALFYWSMLKHGYWLFEFISISQVILEAPMQYYRAFLLTETDDNDLTYFILYHLGVIQKAIDRLHSYIERKTQEVQSLDRILRASATLNHRQRALLSHALRHPTQRYTTASHRTSQRVSYQTARNDLLDLQRRGLLHSVHIGNTDHFFPVSDLQERLAEAE